MIDAVFGENRKTLSEKKRITYELYAWLYSCVVENFIASNETGEITPENVRECFTNAFGEIDSLMEFAGFCRLFSESAKNRITSFPTDEDEIRKAQSTSQIAYVKNVYSDKAYKIFSDNIPDTGAVYFSSFREVCEEVYYGRSRYAILPIYTSTDGFLPSFRRLALKYDLKIACATSVSTDDDTVTRFALFRKGLSDPNFRDADEGEVMLEIYTPSGTEPWELMSSLSLTGVTTLSVNTVSVEYPDSDVCFAFNLTADRISLAALYIFLEGTHIRYNTVGNYIIL